MIIPMAGSGIGSGGPPPNANNVASSNKFKGVGDPNGHIAGYVGDEYIDLETFETWTKVEGEDTKATTDGWVLDSESTTTILAAGTQTARTLADRFAEKINILDFGAVPNVLTSEQAINNTTAIRAAILEAVRRKTSVWCPAGIFAIAPSDEEYIFSLGVLASGSNAFNNVLFEGVDGAKRLSRLDKNPHETFSRGTVFKIFGDMTGKIAFQTGTSTHNCRFRNFTLVGTGWNLNSIGIRHNNAATYFECDNVMIQHFGTGVDIAGDWRVLGSKGNADLISMRRLSIQYCEIGFKSVSWASYFCTLLDCDIFARIPVWNKDIATTSAKINVFGGFYSPVNEFGGVVITGTVSAVSGQDITVTLGQKITTLRNPTTFVLATVSVAATPADIVIRTEDAPGMFAFAEKNCNAVGACRVPSRGVLNEVTAVNSGTSTITVMGLVDATELVGQPIYIVKPAIGFYGENFNVNGCYIEQRQIEDLGLGAMILYTTGHGADSAFRNCTVNLFSSGSGANAIMPLVYHSPSSGIHSFSLDFEKCAFNCLYPKFEVSGEYSVRFKNNRWYCRPTIINHSGLIADGVIRDGDAHYLKTRFPYAHVDANLPFRDLVHQMGSERYQQIGGLLKRPLRTGTAAPTTGWTGEVTITEGSPSSAYTIGMVSSVAGYYDATAIAAGSAAATNGSTVATVTSLSGLYIDRVITIAGIGAAGADLTTRIVDIEIALDGTKKLHLLHAASTSASGVISAVAPVVESARSMGRANSTTPQLVVLGGAEGNDLVQFQRTDGATQVFSFRMGSGTLIVRDVSQENNLVTFTSETAAISARFRAGITLADQGTPASPPAGSVHIYPVTVGGKVVLRALFPTGAPQQLAIEP